jgi:hypothetical protein
VEKRSQHEEQSGSDGRIKWTALKSMKSFTMHRILRRNSGGKKSLESSTHEWKCSIKKHQSQNLTNNDWIDNRNQGHRIDV